MNTKIMENAYQVFEKGKLGAKKSGMFELPKKNCVFCGRPTYHSANGKVCLVCGSETG
jgi:hypothetical protein